MKSPLFRLAFFCDVSGVVHVGHNFGGAQGLRREGPILCWIQAAKSLIFFRIESCADFPPRQTRKDFCRFQRIEVKPQWKWEEVAKEGSWCVYLWHFFWSLGTKVRYRTVRTSIVLFFSFHGRHRWLGGLPLTVASNPSCQVANKELFVIPRGVFCWVQDQNPTFLFMQTKVFIEFRPFIERKSKKSKNVPLFKYSPKSCEVFILMKYRSEKVGFIHHNFVVT